MGGFVVADAISLAPPQAAGLAHSVAPPLPGKPALLGFAGGPVSASPTSPRPYKRSPRHKEQVQ